MIFFFWDEDETIRERRHRRADSYEKTIISLTSPTNGMRVAVQCTFEWLFKRGSVLALGEPSSGVPVFVVICGVSGIKTKLFVSTVMPTGTWYESASIS